MRFVSPLLIVDRATGAMYDHNPNVIKVTLQPEH